MTSAYRSSTPTGSSSPAAAAIATICWASTSSALRGTTVVSIAASRIRRATTAHSSRSARNLGKIRPRLTSPTEWPARPIRCSPRATDLGDSTWITRSTAPMSIPSSRLEVATRHGSSPALSISSTTVRSSRASEPWCERAISSPARSLSRMRQPLGAAAVVDEQDRRLVGPDQLEQLGVDRRPDRAPASPRPPSSGSTDGAGVSSGSTIDSTGTWILRSSSLRTPVSTTRQRAPRPDHEAADLLERVLGGRQPDPLHVAPGGARQPLQGQGQVRRRAWSRRRRGSRRRCTSAPPRTAPGRARSASGTATRGS